MYRCLIAVRLALVAGIAGLGLTGSSVVSSQPHVLKLYVVPLRDQETDASGRPLHDFTATPAQFTQLVAEVNWVYEGTGIQFSFDPATAWQPLADTDMNSDRTLFQRGNEIAAQHLGMIVCFLRWGPNPSSRTGNGNAYPPLDAGPVPPAVDGVSQNYVALPDFFGANYSGLNQGNGSFAAHEFGHYLGLYHTFPGWTDRQGPVYASIPGASTPSRTQADQAAIDFIAANGRTVSALDGDALDDTAPDPSPVLYQAHSQNVCSSREITVQGRIEGVQVTFTLMPDPNNVMSYFAACPAGSVPALSRFTFQQMERMRGTLQKPSRNHLLQPAAQPICSQLRDQIGALEAQRAALSEAMKGAPPQVKGDIGRRISALLLQINALRQELRAHGCP